MTSARKVLGIATTSLRRLLRDRQAAFFILLFPLLLVLVLGGVFGDRRFRPDVGVVAPAGDELAQQVFATLDGEDGIDVTRYRSRDSLRKAVETGDLEAGVVIPEGYTDRLLAGEPDRVGFLARPGELGAQLRPVVESVVGRQAMRLQAARFASEHGATAPRAALGRATELHATMPEVTVMTTTVGEEAFPPGLGRFDLGASSQVLLFMFFTGLASSAVLIQSRQLGVSRRMLSTPTRVGVVVAGEMCGRFVVTLFQGVYIIVATRLIFGVSWGDPAGAVALVVAFALVASGAAMLLGSVLSNDQQAQAVGVILALGMAALGGSMTPLERFSPVMRDIAHLTPHAWGNEAFAELVRHDGNLVDIVPALGVLLAMAGGLLSLAVWRLRRALTTT